MVNIEILCRLLANTETHILDDWVNLRGEDQFMERWLDAYDYVSELEVASPLPKEDWDKIAAACREHPILMLINDDLLLIQAYLTSEIESEVVTALKDKYSVGIFPVMH